MIKKIIALFKGVHFVTVEETLSADAYERVKKQIDEDWPSYLERPILIEGGAKVSRL